ncbi:MAG: hypothetical protein E7048_00060 [Lentisphaerae bacterium]|nr:hypothetical protein [Lentisphaerota bacterium]
MAWRRWSYNNRAWSYNNWAWSYNNWAWSHNNRAWSHNNRNGCYYIPLLWREKYVIKIAEKSVNPTGIFSVINMSSGDMGVITGTSGKKASCQCYR